MVKKKRDRLLEEKRVLKKKFNDFEKEFIRQHKRSIQLKNDIEPIREDYERYKEIKKDLKYIEPGRKLSGLSINTNLSE